VKCPSKYNDARGLDSTRANPAAMPSQSR